MVTCKQCPTNPKFQSISKLRKHQWAEHSEMFKKLKEHKEITLHKEVKDSPTIESLVKELETQISFLQNVVALMKGYLNK